MDDFSQKFYFVCIVLPSESFLKMFKREKTDFFEFEITFISKFHEKTFELFLIEEIKFFSQFHKKSSKITFCLFQVKKRIIFGQRTLFLQNKRNVMTSN